MSKSAAVLYHVLDERVSDLFARDGVVSVDLQVLVDASVSAAIVRSSAGRLGFGAADAAEIATSAAELASNAIVHAGGGILEVSVENERLIISVLDRGAGDAATVRARIAGLMPSPSSPAEPSTGLGLGLGGVARLMHGVSVEAREGGGLIVRAWRKCASVSLGA